MMAKKKAETVAKRPTPETERPVIHREARRWLYNHLQDKRRVAGLRRALENRNNTLLLKTLDAVIDKQPIGIRYELALAWFARWDRDMRGTAYEIEEISPASDPHPAAYRAQNWLAKHLSEDFGRMMVLVEAFSSCSISGNQMASECSETLRRLRNGQTVGDIYVLGLAWQIRSISETKDGESKRNG
jgi:hypothetical protein